LPAFIYQKRETHRQRRAAPGSLGKRIQQMIAEVHSRWIVRDLRNTEQSRHFGQHFPERAAGAQNLDHRGGRTGHQAPNQLWPHLRGRRAGQHASFHLPGHGVQRVFIQFAIPFGEQGRQPQEAEPGMRLHQVRGKRDEFAIHGEADTHTFRTSRQCPGGRRNKVNPP
jgi:hypothetical protein